MPKRRSKDQIIAQILATCLEESVNKTKVVYQANLNFRTVVPYLDQLIDNGLLEASADKYPLYRTTAKGKKALKNLRVIEEIYFWYHLQNCYLTLIILSSILILPSRARSRRIRSRSAYLILALLLNRLRSIFRPRVASIQRTWSRGDCEGLVIFISRTATSS